MGTQPSPFLPPKTFMGLALILGTCWQVFAADTIHFSRPIFVPNLPQNRTNALIEVPMATADFNKDGKLDFVSVMYDEQLIVYTGPHVFRPRIHLGNGNGTFKSPITYDVRVAQ